MVNQQLTQRFGPDVHYLTSAKLDNEVVVIVQHESKRTLQSTLGDWFTQRPSDAPYPVGTLLHYRQILSDEPIYNQLGG
jgi:hypothetical protein